MTRSSACSWPMDFVLSGHHVPISSVKTRNAVSTGAATVTDFWITTDAALSGIRSLRVLGDHEVPALVVARDRFVEAIAKLLPAAVAHIDSCALAGWSEGHLDLLGGLLTAPRMPRVADAAGRLPGDYGSPDMLVACRRPLEKAPALVPLEDHH